jgi:predicted phosphodiesterase
MRLAIVSDIHGNLEALQAVLRDIEDRQVDRIVCLGDVVGYGCDPVACLDLVTERCAVTLMGNHEHAVLGQLGDQSMNEAAQASMDWTKQQLDDRHLRIIARFPMDHTIENIYLVHASPHQPDKWPYILTPPAARRGFDATSAWMTFFGHTHLPTIFALSDGDQCRSRFGHDFQPLDENRYLVNVGSVGQPRDDDPRSCYVIFDTNTVDVYYRRVPYDYKETQRKMVAADAPSLLVERLAIGR